MSVMAATGPNSPGSRGRVREIVKLKRFTLTIVAKDCCVTPAGRAAKYANPAPVSIVAVLR